MRGLGLSAVLCFLLVGCGQTGTSLQVTALEEFTRANPDHKLFASSPEYAKALRESAGLTATGRGIAPDSLSLGNVSGRDEYAYWFRRLAEFAHANVPNVNHVGRLAFSIHTNTSKTNCHDWSVSLRTSNAKLSMGPTQQIAYERLADNYYRTTCRTGGGYEECQAYFMLEDTSTQMPRLEVRAEVKPCYLNGAPTASWDDVSADLRLLDRITYSSPGNAYSIETINFAPTVVSTPTPTPTPTATPVVVQPAACGSGGFRYRDICFYIGGLNQSCTAVCAARGGVHPATRTLIGSLGARSHCHQVATAFGYTSYAGQPPTNGQGAGSANGSGCAARANGRYVWDSAVTTQQDARDSLSRRLCSCSQ